MHYTTRYLQQLNKFKFIIDALEICVNTSDNLLFTKLKIVSFNFRFFSMKCNSVMHSISVMHRIIIVHCSSTFIYHSSTFIYHIPLLQSFPLLFLDFQFVTLDFPCVSHVRLVLISTLCLSYPYLVHNFTT